MTDEINETSATHTSSTETTEQPSESIAAQIDRMVAERTRVVVTHNGVTDGAELADDGRDLRADHNRQVSQYERLVESIDEITGYDANHQPIYKLPHEERMSRHRQATQMAESLAYQKARYAEIQAQRDRNAAAKVASDAEAAARFAFTGGNPERAAILDKALAEEEARVAARKIVGARAKN